MNGLMGQLEGSRNNDWEIAAGSNIQAYGVAPACSHHSTLQWGLGRLSGDCTGLVLYHNMQLVCLFGMAQPRPPGC